MVILIGTTGKTRPEVRWGTAWTSRETDYIQLVYENVKWAVFGPLPPLETTYIVFDFANTHEALFL